MMELFPVTLEEARAFITAHHRHARAPRGWRLGVGLQVDGQLVGVGVAGRPCARHLDDGLTLEISRVCVLPGHPGACSRLYGALRRAAVAVGYRRVVTYTLPQEPGSSLRAAGFRLDRVGRGGEWSRASRPRQEQLLPDPRTRWVWP